MNETCNGWPLSDHRRAYVAKCLAETAAQSDLSLDIFRHAARNAVAQLAALEYLKSKGRLPADATLEQRAARLGLGAFTERRT